MAKYKFAIPITYLMSDLVEVEAKSLKEAIKLVDRTYRFENHDPEYIDGSFQINHEVLDEYEENQIAAEMIKIDKTPKKDLPLLIGKMKTKEAQDYLSNKFKGGKHGD